ncbi:MAG: DUF3500 domain-containing protein [Planctomycetaceae bacterium]|jgi:hypothetical protein|nr:DUF3500 domain-containing protein [Planctomycetaceae bacterium]
MLGQPQHADSSRPAELTRRKFLETTTAGIVTASALSPPLSPATVKAAEAAKKPTPETLVGHFYKTLTEPQKKIMTFPFGHPLRQAVNNNWNITKATVGTDFSKDQQAMIRDIFKSLHSEKFSGKVLTQVESDNRQANRRRGFDGCSVALFGQPGSGKFEFVFSGRHVTRRCDGDSVKGAAFGGPIFYGHAAGGFNEKPGHPGNIYWYQAKRANALFQALDGKQRKLALRNDARPEQKKKTVQFHARNVAPHGVPVADFSDDQKNLARKVIADVLAPFRKVDVDECMKLVEAQFDKLHFAYYQNMDIGNDRVWDVWQIEGPAMVWYFRGKPHVHTWVHIRKPA